MARNPYEQADVIGSAARGANLVLGLQDVAQSRKDRAQERQFGLEDRQRMRELQAREDAAYQRGLALQAPVEEEKALQSAERAGRLAQAQDIPKQIEHQQQQRVYTENGWLTPEQQQAVKGYTVEGAKLGVEASRETIAASKEKRALDAEQRAAIPKILAQYNTATHKAAALSKPEVAEPIMDLYSAISSRDGAKLSQIGPKALPAFDEILRDQFERVVGTKVHGTDDIIVGGNLADVMIDRGKPDIADDDTAVLVYNIVAQSPDGKQRTYQAPITQNRSSEPNDAVMRIPLSQLEQLVGDAAETGLDVQQGKLTPDAIRQEAAQALALNGVDSKTIETMLGSGVPGSQNLGAMGRDIEYIAGVLTGGDRTAAAKMYRDLRRSNESREDKIMKLASTIMKDPFHEGDAVEQATQLVDRIYGSQPAATGRGDDGGSQFTEGQTATNPQTGERMIYRGGAWEPLNGE